MKLTRQEAREILGVEDGAEHSVLKKAFFKKSKEWHPDKVEDEKKEEATAMFQKINAAYQKLINDESDEEPDTFSEDEEDGPDMRNMDLLFEFFRYMEAKMHAQRERHRAAGGGRRGGGGRGPVVGGMFGQGPMAFEMDGPGGPRMVVFGPGPGFGPGGFGAFMGPEDGGGYGGGGGGRYRGGRAYGGRGGRRRQQDYYESDSEDDISSVESDDSEYEKQQERMFMRMEAEERAAEQDRVRQQYDDANRARREAEHRDKRWLAQLSRPARVSFSDTSITLDVDRGAKKRMNDFLSGQLPDCYFWELQYRPVIAGQPLGPWEALEVGQTMEVTVTGLEPGTRYAFRARPCKREQIEKLAEGAEGVDEEDVRCGEWSVEAQHSTSGTATQRASSAAKPAEEAASSRRRDRKAKQAAGEESEADAARRKAQQAAAAAQRQAAEAARREAEQQRERDRQAAMARAAAEYERDAEAARRRAEKEKEQEKAAAVASAAAAAAEKAAKAAAAVPVQRQASSSSVGHLSRSSSTAGAKAEASQAAAAAGSTRRSPNGAGSSGSSTRAAATAAAKPGSSGAKPAAAAAAAAPSSVPPEFRLPDNYVSPAQPSHQPSRPAAGARAPALRDAIGSAPAMRAPTRRSEVQQQQAVRRAPFAAGPPQPTALGRAAAAGDLAVVTSDIFAAEAAAAGMTPDQYLAYQEDLVMQEVLALSAAEDEVRRVAEAEQPPTVPAASHFPTLAQQQPQQVAAPPIAFMPRSQAAPPLPAMPATAAAAPAAAAGPRPGSAGGRGGRGDHAPSAGRGSAGGRGRGRGRGSRTGAGPSVEVQEQAAAPAAVEPAPEPAAQAYQSRARVVAVPRSAAAPPLPAAFAPASGRNSAGGEGAVEEQAPPAVTSSRRMRVREGHAPYRPPSGPRPRAAAANGVGGSAAAAAPSAASEPAAEDDRYGWGSLLQEQPPPADQQQDQQGKAAGKKKGKASRGSKKGKGAAGAAGSAGVPGDSRAAAAEVEQQAGYNSQAQQWEQPSYVGQQQYWEQPAAAQQQWDVTPYQQQSYSQQPQVAGSSMLPQQPPHYGGGAAPGAAAEAYQPYQPAAQAPITFGDFRGPASPRLAMQQAAPVSVQFQEHPQQQPAAAAPYQPQYVDPAGMRYVAVPADQPEQAQQASYQPYMAGQPAPAAYSQSTPQYYGSQWEAPVQQYGWSQGQAQPAQQAQYGSGAGGYSSGYGSATAGGYQQAGAPSDAPALAQKLSPETAAYGVVTSDGSSPSANSSYSYAPQQAAATPGFAQPVTPAQEPAPYRPPGRTNAYRPHLGPPVAGAASSGASSAQQPGGAPNLSVLLPGSR